MDISPSKRTLIVELYLTGNMNYRDIANRLSVSLGTVSNIIRLWRERGSVTSRRFGRPPTNVKLGPRTKLLIVRHSVMDPRATARQIRDRVGGEAAAVTVRTIQRQILHSGRIAYRPVAAPALNAKQKKTRLAWAQKYSKWTSRQWSKVGDLIFL